MSFVLFPSTSAVNMASFTLDAGGGLPLSPAGLNIPNNYLVGLSNSFVISTVASALQLAKGIYVFVVTNFWSPNAAGNALAWNVFFDIGSILFLGGSDNAVGLVAGQQQQSSFTLELNCQSPINQIHFTLGAPVGSTYGGNQGSMTIFKTA
jgi:hypothetical protein